MKTTNVVTSFLVGLIVVASCNMMPNTSEDLDGGTDATTTDGSLDGGTDLPPGDPDGSTGCNCLPSEGCVTPAHVSALANVAETSQNTVKQTVDKLVKVGSCVIKADPTSSGANSLTTLLANPGERVIIVPSKPYAGVPLVVNGTKIVLGEGRDSGTGITLASTIAVQSAATLLIADSDITYTPATGEAISCQGTFLGIARSTIRVPAAAGVNARVECKYVWIDRSKLVGDDVGIATRDLVTLSTDSLNPGVNFRIVSSAFLNLNNSSYLAIRIGAKAAGVVGFNTFRGVASLIGCGLQVNGPIIISNVFGTLGAPSLVGCNDVGGSNLILHPVNDFMGGPLDPIVKPTSYVGKDPAKQPAVPISNDFAGTSRNTPTHGYLQIP